MTVCLQEADVIQTPLQSPRPELPVCCLMPIDKYMYERRKADREAKRAQRQSRWVEVHARLECISLLAIHFCSNHSIPSLRFVIVMLAQADLQWCTVVMGLSCLMQTPLCAVCIDKCQVGSMMLPCINSSFERQSMPGRSIAMCSNF